MQVIKEKFSIIGGDIHKLISLKKDEDWSTHPWRIHEYADMYWVPISDSKRDVTKGFWLWHDFSLDECHMCLKKWYSSAVNKRM